MIQFSGYFDGRVITPEGPVEIPQNVRLRVTIESVATGCAGDGVAGNVEWDELIELGAECTIEGPSDLADRHDHYAHGKPAE